MDEIEIPQYFICPISLQIMRDPVTAVTGITYDRESMEHWLSTAKDATCPVSNQPLPRDSDLTPNHTLRRLIQAWCTANATNGVDQIPTPKPPLDRAQVLKLIQDLGVAPLHFKTLKKIEALATENERNRKCMAEAGVAEEMASLIVRCFKENRTRGLENTLKILHLTWTPTPQIKLLANENSDFLDSLTWVLGCDMENHVLVKTHAMLVLKMTMEVASSNSLYRLKLEFFKKIVRVLREKISKQAINAALRVLIDMCPWGRNRMKIVEAGAVFELIELELEKPEKNITELIFCLMAHLCSCADGRAQFLKHACGIAMLCKRLLRVSPVTDDRAVHVIALISKFSATDEVVLEMLKVGVVSKLCMVLQVDCATYLKQKARRVLRLHSNVWKDSPCIAVYLMTRYPS
ncbi:hypothetical protein L1049_013006 [Liquidambar formosana]|uniref:U-box domain-containing protein n=1 Tax=Liquidambar formosana TaxID=63359 RepID=A0AAP0RJV3_LIQFO